MLLACVATRKIPKMYPGNICPLHKFVVFILARDLDPDLSDLTVPLADTLLIGFEVPAEEDILTSFEILDDFCPVFVKF